MNNKKIKNRSISIRFSFSVEMCSYLSANTLYKIKRSIVPACLNSCSYKRNMVKFQGGGLNILMIILSLLFQLL
jgi:hypothetical protein